MAGRKYANTPCAACSLRTGEDNPRNHGRSHVSIDAASQRPGSGDRLVYHQGLTKAPGDDGCLTPEQKATAAQAAQLAALLTPILDLDFKTRALVLERIAHPGKSLQACAASLHISAQAAHRRLCKALGEWPTLAAAITIRRRQSRTKPATGKDRQP